MNDERSFVWHVGWGGEWRVNGACDYELEREFDLRFKTELWEGLVWLARSGAPAAEQVAFTRALAARFNISAQAACAYVARTLLD